MPDDSRRNVPAYDPETIDALKADAERLTKEIEAWAEREVDSEDTAETVRDLLARVQAVGRKAEEARVADKAPHLDAGREVDAAYAPVKGRLEKLARRVTDKLQPWWDRKDRERQQEERKAREEAEKARKEAERRAALAERTRSIEAEESAEEAARRAKEAEKQASRAARQKTNIGSASGGAKALSARTRRVAILRDINQAFLHYRGRPEVAELLTHLANADVRAQGGPSAVPGFEIKEERKI